MNETVTTMERIIRAENPIWLTIVICLFVLALALILSPTTGAKVLDLIFYKRRQKQKEELTKKYFLNHPIYDYMTMQMQRLKGLSFGNQAKTAAIRDMLFIMFSNYQTAIKNFITGAIDITDKYEFKQIVLSTILSADKQCEQEWLKLELDNIAELVKDFNGWQSQGAAFTHMAIYNITDSDIYDGELERMQEILSILEARFRVTLPVIEKGLMEANGKYSNLDYVPVYFPVKQG